MAREGAGAQYRAGLRRVGTRLLQFAPELDGGQLLNYLCDYARSDAHAHLLESQSQLMLCHVHAHICYVMCMRIDM